MKCPERVWGEGGLATPFHGLLSRVSGSFHSVLHGLSQRVLAVSAACFLANRNRVLKWVSRETHQISGWLRLVFGVVCGSLLLRIYEKLSKFTREATELLRGFPQKDVNLSGRGSVCRRRDRGLQVNAGSDFSKSKISWKRSEAFFLSPQYMSLPFPTVNRPLLLEKKTSPFREIKTYTHLCHFTNLN